MPTHRIIDLLMAGPVRTSGPLTEVRKRLPGLKNATDADLRRAYSVVGHIETILFLDRPELWKGLGLVYDALNGLTDTKGRRQRVVETLHQAISLWKRTAGSDADSADNRKLIVAACANDLEHFEPAFADLSRTTIEKEFGGARLDAKKGGSRNRGAPRIAARLSCAVGAFGDRKEDVSYREFLRAIRPKTKPQKKRRKTA